MPSLPLFPLGTVLLPGARLPLQLFEPRYLELARGLAERDADERCFGVLLIRKGHEVGPDAVSDLHGIGCEARVDAMALAEGAMGVVVHLVATGVCAVLGIPLLKVRNFRLKVLSTGSKMIWNKKAGTRRFNNMCSFWRDVLKSAVSASKA